MGCVDEKTWFGAANSNRGYAAQPEARTPQVGERFPNFLAETTMGRISLEDYADGRWLYLFSFPASFSAVCSTELVSLAAQMKQFDDLGVRVLGLTCSDIDRTLDWVADLEEVFRTELPFPIVTDHSGMLARQFGMLNTRERAATAMRKSFILDPSRKVRLMTDYPARLGRSGDEVLRCLEGLQDIDYTGMALPADWLPGDYMVAPKEVDEAQMQRTFGDDWHKVRDYLMVARG